jgi:hypothetical protein
MRRLVESIEVKYLGHDVVNNSEQMTPMRELDRIAVFYRQIFEMNKLILQDIHQSNLI